MATATSELSILITAKNEASATFSAIKSDFGGLSSALATGAKLAAGAIAAAGAASVAFGISAVKAYAESELQMKKMDTTLKNLGGDFDKNKKTILDVAQATRRLGFDDDVTAQSMTNLFARTKDLTLATELNTIAMDLARYKNIDLQTASDAVGKAFSGNTILLKSFGVTIDDTSKGIIGLRQAHDTFAGNAEAAANTLTVAWTRITNSFDNVKESIGKVLSSEVMGGLDFLSGILEKIEQIDFQKTFDDARSSIVAFFKGVEENTHVLEYLQELWNRLVEVYDTFVKPALADFLSALGENDDTIQSLTGSFVKFLAFLADKVLLTTLGLIVTVLESMAFIIRQLRPLIDGLADSFNKIADTATKAYNATKDFLSIAGKKVSGAVNSALNAVGFRASGGPVSGGSPYIVGEQGPELFVPNMSGSIVPNHALGGGGGVTVNINGGTYLSPDVAQRIGDMIINQFKRISKI